RMFAAQPGSGHFCMLSLATGLQMCWLASATTKVEARVMTPTRPATAAFVAAALGMIASPSYAQRGERRNGGGGGGGQHAQARGGRNEAQPQAQRGSRGRESRPQAQAQPRGSFQQPQVQ